VTAPPFDPGTMTLHFVEIGRGPKKMVLIHGLARSARYWIGRVGALQHDYSLHDLQLLVVFLSKVRALRLDEVEELGRAAPSHSSARRCSVTQVENPAGYITSSFGVNATSTSARSRSAKSARKVRGYRLKSWDPPRLSKDGSSGSSGNQIGYS
jgi:hypothetical protein